MKTILTRPQAKHLWIHSQKLAQREPFVASANATKEVIEHLGYVQIDTINVIERSHHHILYSRLPRYRRQDLTRAQSVDKSIFEYWTHALSYIPTRDFKYYVKYMHKDRQAPGAWFSSVKPEEVKRVLRIIKKDGALTVRDFNDDNLIEKEHEWASRKPSKRALQLAFYNGDLTISERIGMLKKYELSQRHFEWSRKPKAATDKEQIEYLLERSLRSQGLVSLDSICYLNPSMKPVMRKWIDYKVKKSELVQVHIEGLEKYEFWTAPEYQAKKLAFDENLTHILSPFDPLIIQRKRLHALFDYQHRFEAYLPKEKRIFGYFALPVLMGDQMVAAIDLKTDRVQKKLLVQKWNWLGNFKSRGRKTRIEEELHRFEKFQLDLPSTL